MKFLPSSSSDYGDYGRWNRPVFPKSGEGQRNVTSAYVDHVRKSFIRKLSQKELFPKRLGGMSTTHALDSIASDISFMWQYHANRCWGIAYKKGSAVSSYVGVPYPGPYWLSDKDDPGGAYSTDVRRGSNLHMGGHTNWWGTKNKLSRPRLVRQEDGTSVFRNRMSISGKNFNANWQVYTGKETQRNVTPAYALSSLIGLKVLLGKQKALYMGPDSKGDWSKFWRCFENFYNPLIKILDSGIANARLEGRQQLFLEELKADVREQEIREQEIREQEIREKPEPAIPQKAQPTPTLEEEVTPLLTSTRRRGKTSRKRTLAKKKAKQKKQNLTIAGSVSGVVLLGVIFLVMRGRRAA